MIKRLERIPGVGPMSACRFVAYVQDPHRFNTKGLVSFSRLAVVKRESGESSIGGEHLSREGNGSMKALSRTVFNGVMRTRRMNGIKDYYLGSLRRTTHLPREAQHPEEDTGRDERRLEG